MLKKIEGGSGEEGCGSRPMRKGTHWLHALILSLLLIVPLQLQAAGTPYPVTFQDPLVDLSVKVWGGEVIIKRGYQSGTWHPFLNWMPLQFTYDNLDSTIKTITRGRADYSKFAPGVYQDQNHNILRQTATGFRWNDRKDNWIEYNPAGEIKAYGERNGTIGTFQYSGGPGTTTTGVPASEGRIIGLLDHFGAQVLWLDYDANNTLTRVRDAAGRKVEYQWTTVADGMTLAVLDVNGNTWNYAVSDITSAAGGTAIPGSIPSYISQASLGTAISITDPEGHTIIRRWYASGSLALTSYPDGRDYGTVQDYDSAKGIFYARDVAPGGKITETWSELTQDLQNYEFNRRDINGITVVKQSVDTATRTTTYTDARGLNTAVTKDQWNNITKVVSPDGSTISTQYEPAYSNVTQYTNENGVVSQYSYDAKGNRIKTVEAFGLPEQRTTEYTYDANGYRTSQTRKGDANTPDSVTRYEYDNNGNIITNTNAEGGITRYTYDVMGNILTVIDPRGKLWKRAYDNWGHLLSATDPLNRSSNITYDKAGYPVTLTDAVGNISSLGYDPAGKLLSVTDPYGAKTSYAYDADGNLNILTDAENHTLKQDYDLDGRLSKQTDGNNNVTQYIYGDQSSGLNRLLVKVIYPTLSQEFKYDNQNRVTQSIASSAGTAQALDGSPSQTISNTYDAAGYRIAVTDAANRTANIRYDALGRVSQTTDPTGGITRYSYNALGDLASTQDAKGNTHRFEYDKLDRLVKEIRPLGQTNTYAYDPNGNLIQVTDPKGQIKQYTYDAANRRTREDHYLNAATLIAQNAVKSISYTYNTLDRLSGYDDGATVATYTYDTRQLRQIGQSINHGSFSLAASTTYNALGQKSSLTYPDGSLYSFAYDSNNQLSTINFPTGFGSITFNSYTWTVPSQITLPGGTVRTQSYDGLLRLKDLNVKDPGQSQVLNYQYSYDTTNNITTKTTEASATNYSYDTLDRLTGATYTNNTQTNEAYTYDTVANRITDSKTAAAIWTYNENNQLVTADSISYTYDANGNTINQTDASNSANSRNYVYDTNDRLIEVRTGNNTLIAAYSYDPFGRRISKDSGSSKTYYFYSAEGLIAEADATGQVTKSYGYAPGTTFTTNPLWMKTGEAYYTYQNDHLGTPMKLLNQSGVAVWSATYDSFGKATVDPSSTVTNNLRFPGQYYDHETNLHYNWMRYYDPSVGRYTTSDPIGSLGGINMYTYVSGNPVEGIDPWGLTDWRTWVQVIGVAIGLAQNPNINPNASPLPPNASGNPPSGQAIGQQRPPLPQQFPPLTPAPVPRPVPTPPVVGPATIPAVAPAAAAAGGLGILPIAVGVILGGIPGNIGQNDPCMLGDLCIPTPPPAPPPPFSCPAN